MAKPDETHDPSLRSWIDAANDPASEFPIQNLPYGVFVDDTGRHVGVAIGDRILDLCKALDAGILVGRAAQAAHACRTGRLNELMSLGQPYWRELRHALSGALREGVPVAPAIAGCLIPTADVVLELPVQIGNFTDFFSSIHHAANAGRLSRPANPLLPNFMHLPVAYHGRASSICASGHPLRRPKGQFRQPDERLPRFHPTRRLDFELEVGFYVGPGNRIGEPIGLADAEKHVFGLCLVNDWSARDFQSWESQPLGPFLAKNFLTTVSPWVVTLDALAPFRVPAASRGDDAPPLLSYLDSPENRANGGIDIALEATIQSEDMRRKGITPTRISAPRFSDQLWTVFQMLTHHSSNGCNLLPGDLIASGTVSGASANELGCLLEMTGGGAKPIPINDMEVRRYLEDGDEVMLRARCQRDGFRAIGFGECRAVVMPS